jgi:hypothetical protein
MENEREIFKCEIDTLRMKLEEISKEREKEYEESS